MKPVKQMKQITKNFAEGDLSARVPESEIPELNQLAISFNQMAISLADVENVARN